MHACMHGESGGWGLGEVVGGGRSVASTLEGLET